MFYLEAVGRYNKIELPDFAMNILMFFELADAYIVRSKQGARPPTNRPLSQNDEPNGRNWGVSRTGPFERFPPLHSMRSHCCQPDSALKLKQRMDRLRFHQKKGSLQSLWGKINFC